MRVFSFCLCLAGQEQHGPVGLGDKGHKDCQKAGPQLLWEKAGRVGVVQAEKEKAPGRTYIVNYLIIARPGKPSNNYRDPIRKKFGDRLLSRVCCNRTRGNVFNLRVDSD